MLNNYDANHQWARKSLGDFAEIGVPTMDVAARVHGDLIVETYGDDVGGAEKIRINELLDDGYVFLARVPDTDYTGSWLAAVVNLYGLSRNVDKIRVFDSFIKELPKHPAIDFFL